MGPIKEILAEAQFQEELTTSSQAKLVVVDFTASWCGPCQTIAPFYEQLSRKYPNAVFLKVDVDKCQETALSQRVSVMPTFHFYRNKVKVDSIQGADPQKLEEKILKYYDEGTGENEVGVAGHKKEESKKEEIRAEAGGYPTSGTGGPETGGILKTSLSARNFQAQESSTFADPSMNIYPSVESAHINVLSRINPELRATNVQNKIPGSVDDGGMSFIYPSVESARINVLSRPPSKIAADKQASLTNVPETKGTADAFKGSSDSKRGLTESEDSTKRRNPPGKTQDPPPQPRVE